MSYTEGLHHEMTYWERVNRERQLNSFSKVAELRLVSVVNRSDADII